MLTEIYDVETTTRACNTLELSGINTPDLMTGFIEMGDDSFYELLKETLLDAGLFDPSIHDGNVLKACVAVKTLTKRKIPKSKLQARACSLNETKPVPSASLRSGYELNILAFSSPSEGIIARQQLGSITPINRISTSTWEDDIPDTRLIPPKRSSGATPPPLPEPTQILSPDADGEALFDTSLLFYMESRTLHT